MGSRGWSLREFVGLAFASAALAMPVGALASHELAARWAWAGSPGAEPLLVAVTWAAIAAFGADAARRALVQEAATD